MSKRHQSSRRRSYGRRQHELHEREATQRPDLPADEMDLDAYGASSETGSLAFVDPARLHPRMRFAIGE